jgi:hypothetical protein
MHPSRERLEARCARADFDVKFYGTIIRAARVQQTNFVVEDEQGQYRVLIGVQCPGEYRDVEWFFSSLVPRRDLVRLARRTPEQSVDELVGQLFSSIPIGEERLFQ